MALIALRSRAPQLWTAAPPAAPLLLRCPSHPCHHPPRPTRPPAGLDKAKPPLGISPLQDTLLYTHTRTHAHTHTHTHTRAHKCHPRRPTRSHTRIHLPSHIPADAHIRPCPPPAPPRHTHTHACTQYTHVPPPTDVLHRRLAQKHPLDTLTRVPAHTLIRTSSHTHTAHVHVNNHPLPGTHTRTHTHGHVRTPTYSLPRTHVNRHTRASPRAAPHSLARSRPRTPRACAVTLVCVHPPTAPSETRSSSACASWPTSQRPRTAGTVASVSVPVPSPLPPARPWARDSPTHRHGLAAVQRVDGRLGLGVGGELHKGTACPKRRRDSA